MKNPTDKALIQLALTWRRAMYAFDATDHHSRAAEMVEQESQDKFLEALDLRLAEMESKSPVRDQAALL